MIKLRQGQTGIFWVAEFRDRSNVLIDISAASQRTITVRSPAGVLTVHDATAGATDNEIKAAVTAPDVASLGRGQVDAWVVVGGQNFMSDPVAYIVERGA